MNPVGIGMIECDPEIRAARADLFYLVNRKKQSNFIWGEVTVQGHLTFHVHNEPKDGQGCRGWWLFRQMWDHFAAQGTRIVAIEGEWTFGDNLATVNQLTASGLTCLEAAEQTWTAARARGVGFTTISEAVPPVGTSGQYTEVYVRFTR